MKRFQRAAMWAVLVMLSLLTVLSIAGSFLGADRAGKLFTSLPLAVFWACLIALFIVGFVCFRRLRRSAQYFGMHLGFVLILLGGIWGSGLGHRVAASLLGRHKARTGFMLIQKGESSNVIMARDLKTKVADLPFSLKLKDFTIEYYKPDSERWQLVLEMPGKMESGQEAEHTLLDWKAGKWVKLPGTGGAEVRVDQYIDHASPVMSSEEPVLTITTAKGKTATLPGKVGAEVKLDDPKVTVKITQVFERLLVMGSGKDLKVVDRPNGHQRNPAVRVDITKADGTQRHRFIMPMFPMHNKEDVGLEFAYVVPHPSGAEANPASNVPAMELTVRQKDREAQEWLIPERGRDAVGLSLSGMVATAKTSPHGTVKPALYLVKPQSPIKDYKSDLTAIRNGQPQMEKVIEVNDPLHYGGYHFYQHSYDQERRQYTILSVTSDSGLALVYAGFALTGYCIFWWAWFTPAFKYLTRRETASEAGGDETEK